MLRAVERLDNLFMQAFRPINRLWEWLTNHSPMELARVGITIGIAFGIRHELETVDIWAGVGIILLLGPWWLLMRFIQRIEVWADSVDRASDSLSIPAEVEAALVFVAVVRTLGAVFIAVGAFDWTFWEAASDVPYIIGMYAITGRYPGSKKRLPEIIRAKLAKPGMSTVNNPV
jgi:hypothetical protein